MVRVPGAGRFELRLMDGASNPYLLQAGIIAAGLEGLNKRIDPGQPLMVNMYTNEKDYPNLNKLPNDLDEALQSLDDNKTLKEAFGENVIKSYIKLKNQEINTFNEHETFDKKGPITDWEKNNSLNC